MNNEVEKNYHESTPRDIKTLKNKENEIVQLTNHDIDIEALQKIKTKGC